MCFRFTSTKALQLKSMSKRKLWTAWILLTTVVAAYFVFGAFAVNSNATRALLPGKTTHGHYQIELSCNACHTEFMGVKQDACHDCHTAELKAARDTHPASKFNDPTNAARLAKLDAQKCTTCHREHVPQRTGGMGLTLPENYCFHCHEDVAEQRPSHKGMAHNTCSNAGCHNYHDNRALFEKFLWENSDQADILDEPSVAARDVVRAISRSGTDVGDSASEVKPLSARDADAPTDLRLQPLTSDWALSAHAAAAINCRECHENNGDGSSVTGWSNNVGMEACRACHERETDGFLQSRHGMRLAEDLSPMRPSLARLPMKSESAHKELTCSACHDPHSVDTKFAAVEACLNCHDDEHSQNYLASSHYKLWKNELAGIGEANTGVSCATCHLPQVTKGDSCYVEHNQNANLRPNEKMIRSVCMNCHGLQFSLNALADEALVPSCFDSQPSVHVESVDMAQKWFLDKQAKQKKQKQRQKAERQ